LLPGGVLPCAAAEPPQQIPGIWFGGHERFGLLFEEGDGHPYFAFGQYDRATQARPKAQLTLDVDPKLFGDALADEKYVVVQWSDGRSTGVMIVDRLELNELGPPLWSPAMAVSLEVLDQWRTATHLELTVSVGEIKGQALPFAPCRTYVMPDGNRQDALASFISSCSGRK
jgi:hypothetical protein